MLRIALLNKSSVSNEDMGRIATALKQYLVDVCAAWEHAPIDVAFFAGSELAPVGWAPLVAFEQPDQPGCEGYHDVDELDRPYGRAFRAVIPGGASLHDPSGAGASMAGVLSHEAAEMTMDILANAYQDGPFIDPADGHSYAQVAVELADPVQELSYQIQVDGKSVDVSNFIYPAWFDRRCKLGQFDHMQRLTAPLTLAPGGYVIVRDHAADGQVFARLLRRGPMKARKVYHERAPAPWRDKMRMLHGGRGRRRLG